MELGSHQNIVCCYKVEYIDSDVFLILEWISKEQSLPDASLRSWLFPGRVMPLPQALLFAHQIACGMKHAVGELPGLVHRDLKPENILVGSDRLREMNINRLRVTDFGLSMIRDESWIPGSWSVSDDQAKTTDHHLAGTPFYLAPEQWSLEPVGVYTDIYAFGCILYEMLTGRRVVDGRTGSFAMETERFGSLPLYFSMASCLSGSKMFSYS